MGRIKAKTHLEKLGFADSDKKDPAHDKIQEWVCNHIKEVIDKTVMRTNDKPYKISRPKWEHQLIYQSGNYRVIVGFIDVKVSIKGEFYFSDTKQVEEFSKDVFIEIKTQIPTLGELIRQMRSYEAYAAPQTEFVVVSPDDKYENILADQGFHFFKYNDPSKLF